MAAEYTFDVFSSLDGFASYDNADWGPYWGKAGPEFLDRRLSVGAPDQRLVLGANTFRQFAQMIGPAAIASEELDPVNRRMRSLPATVVSSTLTGDLDWPDVTVLRGDAAEVVAQLKESSPVPLRSHGSLSLNRALLTAGLVDRVQVTIFPVIAGKTGVEPIFAGADDFDLELVEHHTFDGRIQELVYRPSLHA